MNAFCVGSPRSMKCSTTPWTWAQTCSCLLVSSGPLSMMMVRRKPRACLRRSRRKSPIARPVSSAVLGSGTAFPTP